MASFKIVFGVLFGLVVVTITALVMISYQNNEISLNKAELVRHTHNVLDETEEVSSLFKEIQLESNTYFVNRDSSIIGPYAAAREELYQRIKVLRDLTSDNARQRARIDSLRLVVDELIAFTDAGISSEGPHSMADLNLRVIRNAQFRHGIREIIRSIKEEEEKLLDRREDSYRLSVAAFNKASFLLLAGIASLLAVAFLVVRYNFNKRIKVQDELKKANDLFANLFYESPIAIVISRLDTGVIIDCNREYTNLLGYSKSELLGKTPSQLGIVAGDEARGKIRTPTVSKNGVYDVEMQLKPKNADPIWGSITMQQIQINNEDCLLSAILDITLHKQAEQRIKEALASEIELNKMKSNFVTLASHEFRTPLTAVLSSASLIERYTNSENAEKIEKHVSRIKASVNVLTSILNEFLSLSKIEEGRIEPKLEDVNLRETIEMLCQNLRSFAKPGQKIMYTHTGEEEIHSDPVLLANIVNNLLSNAVKYSPENCDIYVSSSVNSAVHLSVRDCGIGISKQDQEHLFKRFFRASNAVNIPGTGLGLHIMKHYVDLLNGIIDVRSEPGTGTEFNITFEQLKSSNSLAK
jgi:PAS domain S-box-containing protein